MVLSLSLLMVAAASTMGALVANSQRRAIENLPALVVAPAKPRGAKLPDKESVPP